MNCQELKELFPDYLTGELDQDVTTEVETHLSACESCRLETARMSSAWAALGDLPDEDPSPALSGRFYNMLEEEKLRAAKPETSPGWKFLRELFGSWRPRLAFQFAPALVFMIAGLWIGSQWQPEGQSNGEITQLRSEILEMRQMMSLSLLKQSSGSERLQGVSLSSQVSEPSQPLLETLMNMLNTDPSVNVRLAAVDAMTVFGNVPGVLDKLTLSLARQESPLVQVALIDLLVIIQEKKAIEALRNFIETHDVNPSVKEHAENKIHEFA
jgi:hypothetical protein